RPNKMAVSPSSVPGKSDYISYGTLEKYISAPSSVSNTPYSRGCSAVTRCNRPP
ncbi:unnamed protein product, partial [Ilex paraguariensis]